MKICLIGPSYPFRGGIAHYTTLLYRELRKRHHVTFYGFRRQYPSWLFPGKTDVDESKIPICENGVESVLDSMNPLSWWSVFRRIRQVDPDLVILPWWVSFWTPQFRAISSLVKRLTRAKILFICHNVVPHESKYVDRLCTKFVLKKGDYFIVHSDEDLRNLKRVVPDAHVKKAFHPTYDVFNYGKTAKEAARRDLDVEGNVVLFFGFVRPYKGLKYLIEAMPLILSTMDVTLLVVGEFWEDKREYVRLITELEIGDRVRIIDEYVPNEDVGLYFAASDVVVLPYLSGTGSGIAQLAFGFNKPVIGTNVGCLPEVIDDGRTGFVVNPQRADTIADAVIRFYEGNKEGEFVKAILEERDRFSWDRTVEAIGAFL